MESSDGHHLHLCAKSWRFEDCRGEHVVCLCKSGVWHFGICFLEINPHDDGLFGRLSALLALTRAGLKIAFVETDVSEDPQVLWSLVNAILTNRGNVDNYSYL